MDRHGRICDGRCCAASDLKSSMRRAIQFVLVVALLLSGGSLTVAVMPCCAQAPHAGMAAAMVAPPAVDPAAKCHEQASVSADATGRMIVTAASLLRCPHSVANVQAANAWSSNEQSEQLFSSQLDVSVLSFEDPYQPAAECVTRLPNGSTRVQPDQGSSPPLLI